MLDQAVVHQKAALHVQPEDKEYRRFLGIQLFNLSVVQLALGDEAAATRTAEGYAANAMPNDGPENQMSAALQCCEVLIEKNEEYSTPGGTYAKTREYEVAACSFVSQVLIRKAIELAPNCAISVSDRRLPECGPRTSSRFGTRAQAGSEGNHSSTR